MPNIAQMVRMYHSLREQKKSVEKSMKDLAEKIQKYAVEHGTKDDKGSYYVDDGEFIYGKTVRKSIKLNPERALDYLKEHNLTQCIKKVEELDEEQFELLVSSGEIPLKVVAELSDEKTTYAIAVNLKEQMPEAEMAEVTPSNSVSGKSKMKLSSKRKG